jgi:hypothetical protein
MTVVAEIVYLLCTATSLLCTILLFRAYRKSRARLLLWSGLCFACLCLNNFLLFLDVIVLETVDLSAWRLIPALVGVGMLCDGLVEGET